MDTSFENTIVRKWADQAVMCLVNHVSLKKNILRFCLCIFESDNFNSDCPVHNFRKKMMKYLKI